MMKVSERPILVKGSDSNMKQAVLILLGGLLLLGACANKQPKPVVTVEKDLGKAQTYYMLAYNEGHGLAKRKRQEWDFMK